MDIKNTISAEAQGKLLEATATPVESQALGYINDIIERASAENPATRARVIRFVEDSIMGRSGARSILHFNKNGADEGRISAADRGKEILAWPEFKEYCRYLDQALTQIARGTIEVGKSSAAEVAVLSGHPEMKKLLDRGVSLVTVNARIKAINELEKAKEAISGQGDKSLIRRYGAEKREVENINSVIEWLKNDNPAKLKLRRVETVMNKMKEGSIWDSGVLDKKSWGTDTVYCEEYISRILGNSKLASQAVAIKKVFEKKKYGSGRTMEMKNRLERFLESFERLHGKPKYQPILLEAQTLLNAGNKRSVEKAVGEINKILKKDFRNLDASSIAMSENGLAKALRKIGETETAGDLMVREGAAEIKDKNVIQEIQKIMEANKEKARIFAQRRYFEIRDQLKDSPLEYEEFCGQDSGKAMEMLATVYLQKNAITDYIKTNGSSALPEILKTYDDMKGLHGAMNWSDERIQLTKELAVTVAAMVVTAILTGGASLIVGTMGRMALATASTIRFARAAGVAVRVGEGLLKAEKAVAVGQKVLRANRLTSFMTNTVVFTGAQSAFRSAADGILGQEYGGESQKFFNNLKTNAVMFAAFEGAGALSGKLISKLGLDKMPGALAASRKFSLEIAGDITAMYALYLIETGKIEMSGEELIKLGVTAIAYRVGFKAFGKLMPKINAKIEGKFEKFDAANEGKIAKIKEAGEARRAERERLKEGDRVDFPKTKYSEPGTGKIVEISEDGERAMIEYMANGKPAKTVFDLEALKRVGTRKEIMIRVEKLINQISKLKPKDIKKMSLGKLRGLTANAREAVKSAEKLLSRTKGKFTEKTKALRDRLEQLRKNKEGLETETAERQKTWTERFDKLKDQVNNLLKRSPKETKAGTEARKKVASQRINLLKDEVKNIPDPSLRQRFSNIVESLSSRINGARAAISAKMARMKVENAKLKIDGKSLKEGEEVTITGDGEVSKIGEEGWIYEGKDKDKFIFRRKDGPTTTEYTAEELAKVGIKRSGANAQNTKPEKPKKSKEKPVKKIKETPAEEGTAEAIQEEPEVKTKAEIEQEKIDKARGVKRKGMVGRYLEEWNLGRRLKHIRRKGLLVSNGIFRKRELGSIITDINGKNFVVIGVRRNGALSKMMPKIKGKKSDTIMLRNLDAEAQGNPSTKKICGKGKLNRDGDIEISREELTNLNKNNKIKRIRTEKEYLRDVKKAEENENN